MRECVVSGGEKTKPIFKGKAYAIRQKAKGTRNSYALVLLCPYALFAKQSQFADGVN